MNIENIFSELPENTAPEVFQDLLSAEHFRIERIISRGHASPENFWYDQKWNEWVIVLKGRAQLRFKDQDQPVMMAPGDYINIPANMKHRVEWTDPDQETIWLAIHY